MEFFIHVFLMPSIYITLLFVFFGRLFAFSFIHIFLYSYILFIYIRALEVKSELNLNSTFIILVWLIPIFVILTSGIVKHLILRFNKKASLMIKESTFNNIDIFLIKYKWVIIIYFPVILSIYVLDKGINSIALISLLTSSDSIEVMNKRISGLESNISPILTGIYSYSRALIFPLLFSFLSTLLANKKIGVFPYVFVLIIGLLFSLATASKSPAAIFLVSGLLSYLLSKKGKLNLVKISFFTFVILLIPTTIYPLLYGVSGLAAIPLMFESLWRRLTWVPSFVSGIYFSVFGENNNYYGFSSNRILAYIMQRDYVNVASYVYENFFDTTIKGGLVNASYFASFYADWGVIGVLLSTLVIGIIITLYDYYFYINNTLFTISCKVIVIIGMIHLMLTNFYSVSLGRGFISIPIILLLLNNFAKRSVINEKNSKRYTRLI